MDGTVEVLMSFILILLTCDNSSAGNHVEILKSAFYFEELPQNAFQIMNVSILGKCREVSFNLFHLVFQFLIFHKNIGNIFDLRV